MKPGHLFVVNGRLDALSADAVVIPTDARFAVRNWWRDTVGLGPGDTWNNLRPEGWARGAALPARQKRTAESVPEVWFLDVVAGSPSEVGQAALRVVEAIVEHSSEILIRSANSAGRDLPLIAMPVVGTGAGGQSRRRGQVIAALVSTLRDATDRLGVDVALVASERSDYAALQHRRRDSGTPPTLADATIAEELGQRVRRGEVALFFGAGVSIAAGLPSWRGLLDELVHRLGLDEIKDKIEKLGPLEQAELVQVTLAAARQADPAGSQAELGRMVAEVVGDHAARPSLAHTLLASLQVREAVTTNYDRLYERAVTAACETEDDSPIAVLPWARTSSGRPWLLKMHGDVEHHESIVLSRSSFVHYDSRWKPVGSLVQSLMLTKHLLVVGASMTDDNLLRFAYEVAGLRESIETTDHSRPEIGTVIGLAVDEAFSRLWEGRFKVVVPQLDADDGRPELTPHGEETTDERDERQALERRRAARSLTVFLDAVAMHSVRESPYLLDHRYADGRDDETARLVDDINAVAERARSLASDDAWRRLVHTLETFGVRVR
ncbi:SIR2 family protein [Isoptericola cucumis]|uniref:SIR2 family protein n=1 Tax=Isoptericola cucumis TaxID=1776856 RepID=A0ABQ2B4Q9_9MICO|nr:SIR2 family protein [Isoptericola cucumis]GGI06078.1 SIR2 family protein [Isoptericola cucumis]